MKIENEDLFKEKLKTGINLFTGAGFSVLKSPTGRELPTGRRLCEEIVRDFNLDISPDKGLNYVVAFCAEEKRLQDYLREKFYVEDYNPLYDNLNRINIKTYTTTNIDNIIRLVIDKSPKYYLKSIKEYGASMNGSNEIVYIPLHGDVLNINSKLYFDKFDLSLVNKENEDLFNQMESLLKDRPILFWGYSFEDNDVLAIITKLIEMNCHHIWVQCLPTDKDSIKLFGHKGCNIIQADTQELLAWIGNNIDCNQNAEMELKKNSALDPYRIPEKSQLLSVPRSDYYRKGETDWYPILEGVPYERKLVADIENAALKNKNVVIIGSQFAGKTTLLMQLARRVETKNKFYVNGIDVEQAKFIIKNIGDASAWVFFNNCSDDILAFNKFIERDNIKVVGTSDEYRFEVVRHLLDISKRYKIFNCSEIEINEAQKIYNKIPVGIRTRTFKYKDIEKEKYTMFELMLQNVYNILAKKQTSKMLKTIYEQDQQAFKVIALATYLSINGSALSYYNVATALNIKPYPDAFKLLSTVKSYLRTYNFNFDQNEESQDFFVLRSSLLGRQLKAVLLSEYKHFFAQTIKEFVCSQSKYRIVRYNVYCTRAYDASFFSQLFTKEEAMAVYEYLYRRDDNPYILQQYALCLSSFHDYKKAFGYIDQVISEYPSNFSFKNSQAIILFEANKEYKSKESLSYLRQAMETLKQCYLDDKRKLYHAQKFTEFALYLSKYYYCDDYIDEAWRWINEVSTDEDSQSHLTKRLKMQLANVMAQN